MVFEQRCSYLPLVNGEEVFEFLGHFCREAVIADVTANCSDITTPNVSAICTDVEQSARSLVSVANRTLHFVFEVEQILVHFFFCGQGQWKAHATSVGGAVEVSPFARFSITRKVLPRAHAHMYTRTP